MTLRGLGFSVEVEVSGHAVPRTTHDLDFVLELPTDSIPLIVREFEDDFHIDELAIRSAYSPPYQFNAIETLNKLLEREILPKSS